MAALPELWHICVFIEAGGMELGKLGGGRGGKCVCVCVFVAVGYLQGVYMKKFNCIFSVLMCNFCLSIYSSNTVVIIYCLMCRLMFCCYSFTV